jgi:hypothetical protein
VPRQTDYYASLCVQINAAWKKLDHYYELTDQSPVYIASLVLHPAFTWDYLESIWRSKPHWISHHKLKIQRLWETSYLDGQVPIYQQNQPLNRRHRLKLFNLKDDKPEGLTEDDYKRWCRRPRDRALIKQPPLSFWMSEPIQTAYPRLQKLALNLFTIPAMSDEPERVFSSAGAMITP